MKDNPFCFIGSYIGLIIGLILSYFLGFALIFYLAETGQFHYLFLLVPFLLPIIGFYLGWKIKYMFKKIALVGLVLIVLVASYFFFLKNNEESFEIAYESFQEENDYYSIDMVKVSEDSFGSERINNIIDRKSLEFKEMAEDDVILLREDGFEFSYYLSISIEDYQTEQYIFYVLNFGEYTGGANANQYVKTIGLDKKSGDTIQLSNIVDKDLVMDKVIEKLLPLDNEGYLFDGAIEELSFSDLENFYIKDDKLVFLFPKYSIAPGAAGIIDIAIDMSELGYNGR